MTQGLYDELQDFVPISKYRVALLAWSNLACGYSQFLFVGRDNCELFENMKEALIFYFDILGDGIWEDIFFSDFECFDDLEPPDGGWGWEDLENAFKTHLNQHHEKLKAYRNGEIIPGSWYKVLSWMNDTSSNDDLFVDIFFEGSVLEFAEWFVTRETRMMVENRYWPEWRFISDIADILSEDPEFLREIAGWQMLATLLSISPGSKKAAPFFYKLVEMHNQRYSI